MQPVNITLKLTKSTKGKHVYEMHLLSFGTMGALYLPKDMFPGTPPAELTMELKAK